MAIAKAAVAGVGVVGLITATTIAMVSSSGIPEFHFLKEDSDYSDKSGSGKDYHGKYGETYGSFLVGVTSTTATTGKPATNNDKWWEWAFNNLYLPKTATSKGKFKDLDKQGKTPKDLKDTCFAAYKEKNGNGTAGNILMEWGNDTENTKILDADIWQFCSPLGERPESIKEGETYEGSLASDTTKKKKLVSITSDKPANKLFWSIKQDQFKSENQNSTSNVKDWCKGAYKVVATATASAPANTPTYNKEGVYKWCSLEGKEIT